MLTALRIVLPIINFPISTAKCYPIPMRKRFYNVVQTFSYISIVTQWMWMVITLLLPVIVSSQWLKDMSAPDTSVAPAVQSFAMPTWIANIIGVLVVVIGLSLTIYALVSLPRSIRRTGAKTTHETAVFISEHIPHAKPLDKKDKEKRIFRYSWLVRLALWLIPILLLAVPPPQSLPHNLSIACGLILGTVTLFWLAVEYCLSDKSKGTSRRQR